MKEKNSIASLPAPMPKAGADAKQSAEAAEAASAPKVEAAAGAMQKVALDTAQACSEVANRDEAAAESPVNEEESKATTEQEVPEGFISIAESERREREAWLRGRNEKIEAEWLAPDLSASAASDDADPFPPGLFAGRRSVWD